MNLLVLFYNEGRFNTLKKRFNVSFQKRVRKDSLVSFIKEPLELCEYNSTSQHVIIIRDTIFFDMEGKKIKELKGGTKQYKKWLSNLTSSRAFINYKSVYVILHQGNPDLELIKIKDNEFKLSQISLNFKEKLKSDCARSSNENEIRKLIRVLEKACSTPEVTKTEIDKTITSFLKNTFREGLEATLELLHYYYYKNFETDHAAKKRLEAYLKLIYRFRVLTQDNQKKIKTLLESTLDNYISSIKINSLYVYNHNSFKKFSEELLNCVTSFKILDQ